MSAKFFHPKTSDALAAPYTISVEIESELARQFVEFAHYDSPVPSSLRDLIAEAIVRALEEDDADV